MKFSIINSKADLLVLVTLLGKKFKWSEQECLELVDKLIILNSEILIYGIMCNSANSKTVIGGLLLIHQGNFQHEQASPTPILNMSSWYMPKSVPIATKLGLLNFLITNFRDQIITNYTASSAVRIMLYRFGFKYMPRIRDPFYFFDFFNFKKNKIKDYIDFTGHETAITFNEKFSLLAQKNVLPISVSFLGNTITITGRKRIYFRGRHRWRFPVYEIFKIDNLVVWQKYCLILNLKIMIRFRCLKVVSHLPTKPSTLDENASELSGFLIHSNLPLTDVPAIHTELDFIRQGGPQA